MGEEREVEIAALGSGGDGIAESGGLRLFVPLAAPGDRLRVRIADRRGEGWRAHIVARIADGPVRRSPPCVHFGDCGGCALQHLDEAAYGAWKRERVVECLAQRGLDPGVVAPMIPAVPADRRRLRLAVERRGGRLAIGLHARESHRIVEIAECPVSDPALVAALRAVRIGLASLWPDGTKGAVALTRTDSGVDVLLIIPRALDAKQRTALVQLAEKADLARLSAARTDDETPEPIAFRRIPRILFGTVPVTPPPGAFLQAGTVAERTLVDLVSEAVPAGVRIADLYAGAGTFSFPLARRARRVLAVDRDGSSVDALAAAARGAGLGSRLAVERRDLERRPLTAGELRTVDAVVLDPPRGGAAAQVKTLATAAVPLVVYVSCNPATFARDARVLTDGGLMLDRVTPVDQFLWSTHVELVAVFRRPA